MFDRGFMTMLQGMYHIYLGVCLGFYELDGPGRSRALGEYLRRFPFFSRIRPCYVRGPKVIARRFGLHGFGVGIPLANYVTGAFFLQLRSTFCTGMAVPTSDVQNLLQPSQPHSDSKPDLVTLLPTCPRSDTFHHFPLREFTL